MDAYETLPIFGGRMIGPSLLHHSISLRSDDQFNICVHQRQVADDNLSISQILTVHFQPGLRFPKPWADRLQTAPETDGVVHVFQVVQFMQNDVVTVSGRDLYESPVE